MSERQGEGHRGIDLKERTVTDDVTTREIEKERGENTQKQFLCGEEEKKDKRVWGLFGKVLCSANFSQRLRENCKNGQTESEGRRQR